MLHMNKQFYFIHSYSSMYHNNILQRRTYIFIIVAVASNVTLREMPIYLVTNHVSSLSTVLNLL